MQPHRLSCPGQVRSETAAKAFVAQLAQCHIAGDDESGVSLPPSTNSEVEERVEESVFMEVYSTTRIASMDLVNGKDL